MQFDHRADRAATTSNYYYFEYSVCSFQFQRNINTGLASYRSGVDAGAAAKKDLDNGHMSISGSNYQGSPPIGLQVVKAQYIYSSEYICICKHG